MREREKVKKCCKVSREVTRYAALDRVTLFERLDLFIDQRLQELEELAYDDFWGSFLGRENELTAELLQLSGDVQFMSFACDYEIEPGKTAIDLLLEQSSGLSLGAQAFARAIRRTTMRLYEAVDVVPCVAAPGGMFIRRASCEMACATSNDTFESLADPSTGCVLFRAPRRG